MTTLQIKILLLATITSSLCSAYDKLTTVAYYKVSASWVNCGTNVGHCKKWHSYSAVGELEDHAECDIPDDACGDPGDPLVDTHNSLGSMSEKEIDAVVTHCEQYEEGKKRTARANDQTLNACSFKTSNARDAVAHVKLANVPYSALTYDSVSYFEHIQWTLEYYTVGDKTIRISQ